MDNPCYQNDRRRPSPTAVHQWEKLTEENKAMKADWKKVMELIESEQWVGMFPGQKKTISEMKKIAEKYIEKA